MKKRIYTFFLILLCFIIGFNVIYASPLDDLITDDFTGWIYSSANGHMGSKFIYYKYTNGDVKEKYSTYVDEGMGLWGTVISAIESPKTTEGVIDALPDVSTDATARTKGTNPTAKTSGREKDSFGHFYKWKITIFENNFDDNAEKGKIRTLAHEFGHVYGLGDLRSSEYSSQIMYGTYSTSKNVKDPDIWGMKVVTHSHTHDTTSTYTYSSEDDSYHMKRCNECQGYFEEAHTWVDLGGIYRCTICGYTR